MQVYMHGGSAAATGHGCLNDLWRFDLATRAWTQVPLVTSKQCVSRKLATVRSAPAAACQHTLAIDSAGSLILQGGTQSRGETNRTLQVAVQLVTSVPGGVPTDVAMACRIRPAGLVAALALCRCAADTRCRYLPPPSLCRNNCARQWCAACSACQFSPY